MLKMAELSVARINRATELILIVIYATMMTVIPLSVFFRYALNDSIIWAEELARFLFIWLTFLGAGLGVGKNVHVGVDAVTMKFSNELQWRFKLAVNIGVTAFLIVLIVYGTQFTLFGMTSISMILRVPMGLVYLAAPLGGVVMLANVILEISQVLTDQYKGGTR